MRLVDFEQFFQVERDGEFDSLCNITTVTEVKCLSFAGNESFVRKACKLNHVSCVIVPPELAKDPVLVESGKGIAVAQKPKTAFHMLHNELAVTGQFDYIEPMADTVIGKNCRIDPTVSIAAKGVVIGDNVVIEERAIIREGVTIGDNTLIMAGAYIGYSACLAGRDLEGNLLPLISTGRLQIGSHVQVGAYSCLAKGLFPYETSELGDYSLVGFSCDLSHNSHTGKNAIILDQTQVCGNTVIEDDVHLAPQAIVSNRLTVEEKADVAIGSVVVTNVKKETRVAGNYAIENSKFLLWHRKKLSSK